MGRELKVMPHLSARRSARRGEQGFTIVTVLFLLAILALTLSLAAPRLAREIQRDREEETMQRGMQYARAVKMYYKKNNAYPPNVEALMKASGAGKQRYLRKKYVDPITGKDDWKAISVGQNKAPTAMDFFGKPLAGASTGMSSVAGGGIAGASSLGSSLSSSSSTSSSTTGSASSSTSGSTNATFGGLGVMGFAPGSAKKSLRIYKTKNHYNEWEFVYDPVAEQKLQAAALSGSQALAASSSSSAASSTTK